MTSITETTLSLALIGKPVQVTASLIVEDGDPETVTLAGTLTGYAVSDEVTSFIFNEDSADALKVPKDEYTYTLHTVAEDGE